MGNAAVHPFAPPPQRPAQPVITPLHLQSNGLFRASYLIPATAAVPAPSRSRLGPGVLVAPGRPFCVVFYFLPNPSPRGPKLAGAQQGAGREAQWGPLPLSLCSCSSPAAGRLARPTSPRTVSEKGGGARGGGQRPGRGF